MRIASELESFHINPVIVHLPHLHAHAADSADCLLHSYTLGGTIVAAGRIRRKNPRRKDNWGEWTSDTCLLAVKTIQFAFYDYLGVEA